MLASSHGIWIKFRKTIGIQISEPLGSLDPSDINHLLIKPASEPWNCALPWEASRRRAPWDACKGWVRKGPLFLPQNEHQNITGKLHLRSRGCVRPDPAASPLALGQPFSPASWMGTRCWAVFPAPKNSAGAAHVFFYSCLYQVCASALGALITRRKKCARWFCITDWSVNLK